MFEIAHDVVGAAPFFERNQAFQLGLDQAFGPGALFRIQALQEVEVENAAVEIESADQAGEDAAGRRAGAAGNKSAGGGEQGGVGGDRIE